MSCRPRASLRFLVCAAALALAPLPGVTALSAQPGTLEIDLPAQPLGQSLNTLAQQAGVQIAAPGELVAGKQAPALKGRFTPQAALARLLVGSGLEARREGAGFVLRRAAPIAAEPPAAKPDAPSPARETPPDVPLPGIQVKGETDRETAWGPVMFRAAARPAPRPTRR
jgi:iron complex outermembrane receptor protein